MKHYPLRKTSTEYYLRTTKQTVSATLTLYDIQELDRLIKNSNENYGTDYTRHSFVKYAIFKAMKDLK